MSNLQKIKEDENMSAALEEITRQVREEARVAILEQIKIIRAGNQGQTNEARENLAILLKVNY